MNIMKEKMLPWSGLDGPVYEAGPLKIRKAGIIKAAWAMSPVLIAGGIYYRYPLIAAAGALYVLALVMKKDVALTERGIETFYRMKIANSHQIWNWNEIDRIASEINDEKYGKEKLAVYFRKDNRVKGLCFEKSFYKEIIELAKSRNGSIKVEDE